MWTLALDVDVGGNLEQEDTRNHNVRARALSNVPKLLSTLSRQFIPRGAMVVGCVLAMQGALLWRI